MGVYIKGMEMPTSCGECYVGFCKQIGCELSIGFDDYKISRHPNCPLVPVPKHGRLVDADVLTELCRDIQSIEWNKHTAPYSWEYAYEDFENVILNAPTIIPAEETNKEATNDQNNS